MARAEQAAIAAYPSNVGPVVHGAFIKGYEQAEKEVIDWACNWLFLHLTIIVDCYNEDIHEQVDRDDFIRSFREDMEKVEV